MRRLSLCLDSLPALREVSGGTALDLSAATSLAELAGADAVRLGINEELRPVAEADVYSLDYDGWRRAGHDAWNKLPAAITPETLDVTRYDLVFLGSPI